MNWTRMLLLTSVIFTAGAWAVPPDLWIDRVFDERAEFKSVVILPSDTLSGALLAGTATEGQFQFYLVRVDSSGNTVRNDLYGLADQFFGMTFDSSGGFTLAGHTSFTGELNYRFMRFDSSGGLDATIEFGSSLANESIRAIRSTRGGDYFCAADVDSGNSNIANARLMRIASNGQEEWAIDIPMGWRSSSLTFARDTLFLYGTTDTIASLFDRDYFELEADTAGEAGVYRAFGGPRMDHLTAATQLLNGTRILVGTSNSFSADSSRTEIWIVATTSTGDSLWSRRWRAPGSAVATGVAHTIDLDSGFVVSGYTVGPDSLRSRGILAKYNAAGDSIWTFTFPDSADQRFNSAVQDARFRYHIAGMTRVGTENRGLYLVTEFDPNAPGQQPPQQFALLVPPNEAVVSSDTVFFDWETAIDPDGDAVRYALLLDSDTLFQQPIPFGPLNFSHYIWRNDSDDVAIYWRVVAQDIFNNVRICEDRHRILYRVIPDSTGPFSLSAPDSGVALTQPWTEFRWFPAYDPDPIDTIRYSVHFLVGDTSISLTGLSDTFLTVSFTDHPVIGEAVEVEWHVTADSRVPVMERDSRERWTFVSWSAGADGRAGTPAEFGIRYAAPNPFNSTSRIAFALDRRENVRLDIHDVAGRLVTTLVDGSREPGEYEVSWTANDFASGVYFARLIAGRQIHTAKLLLIR